PSDSVGAGALVTDTDITGNGTYAIGAEPGTRLTVMTGVTATNNGGTPGTKNGIEYRGGAIRADEEWIPGLPWFITGATIQLGQSSSAILQIDAGVSVYVDPSLYINVWPNGQLLAVGDTGNRITFTSSRAIATNADRWSGIAFASPADAAKQSRIAYADLSNAGYNNYFAGILHVSGGQPTFDHVNVSGSYTAGIFASSSASTVTL